jgi:hypothetical protein
MTTKQHTTKTTYAIGDSVRDTKWGGICTGTIVEIKGGDLFVQWHGTCVEDQIATADVVPAPDVPRPDSNGFRALMVGR